MARVSIWTKHIITNSLFTYVSRHKIYIPLSFWLFISKKAALEKLKRLADLTDSDLQYITEQSAQLKRRDVRYSQVFTAWKICQIRNHSSFFFLRPTSQGPRTNDVQDLWNLPVYPFGFDFKPGFVKEVSHKRAPDLGWFSKYSLFGPPCYVSFIKFCLHPGPPPACLLGWPALADKLRLEQLWAEISKLSLVPNWKKNSQ